MKRILRVLSYLITLTLYLFLPSVYAQTAPSSCNAFSEQIEKFKKENGNENYIKILEQLRKLDGYSESDWLSKAIVCAKARGIISNHPSTTVDWLVVDFLLNGLEQEQEDKNKSVEIRKALNAYRYWRDPYFITEANYLFIGQTGKRIRKALIEDGDEIIPIPISKFKLAVKIEEANNEIKPTEVIKIKELNDVLTYENKKCIFNMEPTSLIIINGSKFLSIETIETIETKENKAEYNANDEGKCFEELEKDRKLTKNFKWLYFNDVSGLCRDIKDELNYYFIGGNDKSLDYKHWENWFRQSKYEWREVLDSIITSCNPSLANKGESQ